jgi:malate/lactate dehydrogenase
MKMKRVEAPGLSSDSFSQSFDHHRAARERDEIFSQGRNGAYEIINRKGHTNFAVALVVVKRVSSLLCER